MFSRVLGHLRIFHASTLAVVYNFTNNQLFLEPSIKHQHKHDPCYAPAYSTLPSNLQLEQIVIINRHGDRSPISRKLGSVISDKVENEAIWHSKLPPDEFVNKLNNYFPVHPKIIPIDKGQEPFSQLTLKGTEELQQVGKKLRSFLVDEIQFLPPVIDASQIYVRATNIRRTQRSAQNLLYGLYPHDNDRNGDHNKIIINVREESKETLFPNSNGLCYRQDEIIHSFLQTKAIEKYPGFDDLKQRLINILGIEESIEWSQVREVLTCYLQHELELPQGVSHELINEVVGYTGWMWGKWFSNTELIRLAIGRFIEEMVEKMENKINDKNNYKVLIYSGHDSTLVPLLCCLEIYQDSWPPYSSHIMFQIARDVNDQSTHIRVLYNDEPIHVFGFDTEWITFDQFLSKIRMYIPKDYQSECQPLFLNFMETASEVKNTIK